MMPATPKQNQNTVLSSDDRAASNAAAWMPPTVDGPRATRRQRPTLAELDDIERIAWEEGYAKGEAAGLAAAEQDIKRRRDELEQRAQRLDGMMKTLAEPLQQLDEEVETQLVSLALSIARHLLRRELRADPSQVIAVIRDTVGLLPLAERNVRVHLHPLDAVLVRELLVEPQAERAWTLVEDPVMSRGGCRVSTDVATIDARLEARLATVMNHLLGDARLNDERNAQGDIDSATDATP